MSAQPTVGVIGVGYVGLVSAACFADLGYEVVCRDILPDKVTDLRAGKVPFYEPGLADLVTQHRDRLTFTTDMREVTTRAQVIFVCVDTPPLYSGDADLSRVESVIAELPDGTEGVVLVMKSTVPVGTGRRLRALLDARGLAGVGYVSNPEFLKEGDAIADFMHPDRVVVGGDDDASIDAVANLYASLGSELVRTDVATAEMVKSASNAFLATKISFINEIANVCEETGADVIEVARGMGLDKRIGHAFLNAGIGYGGSCLPGDETVLVRTADGRVRLLSLEALHAELAGDDDVVTAVSGYETLSWDPESGTSVFHPIEAATRRHVEGPLVEVRTKMGRRIRTTEDHPFVTSIPGEPVEVRSAADLTASDWLPLSHAPVEVLFDDAHLIGAVANAAGASGIADARMLVRPGRDQLRDLPALELAAKIAPLGHPRPLARAHDIRRVGTMHRDEAERAGLDLEDAQVGTARNGTWVPSNIRLDAAFWRVAGLYVAEGHCTADGEHGRQRMQWTFHRTAEQHLVDEVVDYWELRGVKVTSRQTATAATVSISSKVLASWWLGELRLGRTSYEKRIPDAIWTETVEHQRAFVEGMWEGDGSWSAISGGPSVALEYGTASRELADGLVRLLGQLGIVARWKIGRTANSTLDNHWIIVAGADQVERMLHMFPNAERQTIQETIDRQTKRIAPTGYRITDTGTWVRIVSLERQPFSGYVYSLEVPGPHTFSSTGGLAVHNCFPKDVSALKQLAGNSGYHFQLLNAVIEVNELQKRRVIGKLQKHLGSLRGKRIALLGLAFKPNTDDMREAASLVLSARLTAEGAEVCGYDPIAGEIAKGMLSGVEVVNSVEAAASGADAIVVVTEWPQFREIDLVELAGLMRSPVLVDGRNLFSPQAAVDAGFLYEGVGRPTPAVRPAGAPDRRTDAMTAAQARA